MSPDTLFQSANLTAMVGWLLLLIGPLAPALTNRIAGLVIPALLSVGYAALVLAFWSGASGGFDSLPNVMLLFTNPWIALAGWVHYLAFDLFLGAWAARKGRAAAIPHLVLIPVLALTLLFGPIGFVLFLSLSLIWRLRAPLPA